MKNLKRHFNKRYTRISAVLFLNSKKNSYCYGDKIFLQLLKYIWIIFHVGMKELMKNITLSCCLNNQKCNVSESFRFCICFVKKNSVRVAHEQCVNLGIAALLTATKSFCTLVSKYAIVLPSIYFSILCFEKHFKIKNRLI